MSGLGYDIPSTGIWKTYKGVFASTDDQRNGVQFEGLPLNLAYGDKFFVNSTPNSLTVPTVFILWSNNLIVGTQFLIDMYASLDNPVYDFLYGSNQSTDTCFFISLPYQNDALALGRTNPTINGNKLGAYVKNIGGNDIPRINFILQYQVLPL